MLASSGARSAHFQSRIASSNRAGVKGFCKNIVPTGIGFTGLPDMEAMRLYPPAWAIGRESTQPVKLGGYTFPKGTTILISPWVLHRDPRYFSEPEAFRPERWMGNLARELPRFAYMPFGGGPRICIGQRFALIEAILVLTTMAQRFSMVWQTDRKVMPFPSITLRPNGGVWLKITERRALH